MKTNIFLRQVYYIGLMIAGASLLGTVTEAALGWDYWWVVGGTYGTVASYFLCDKADADAKRALL